jgi:heptosyltransferase-2
MMKFLDRFLGAWILRLFFRTSRHSAPSIGIQRVLILRLGAIGDTVLFLPALRGLLDHNPKLEVHIVTWSSNVAIYELIQSPQLIIHNLGTYRSLTGLSRLLRFAIRERGLFQVVFDLEQFAHLFAIIGRLLKPTWLVGFDVKGQHRSAYYDQTYQYDPEQHESLNFLGIIQTVFPQVALQLPELVKKEKDATYIGIHPGSKWPQKRWPMARFIQLTEAIHAKYPTIPIHLCVGPEDARPEEIPKYVNIRDGLSLVDIQTEMKSCRLLISNDNGIMHLAAWMGVPVIGIFGMSDPVQWHALGNENLVVKSSIDCAPCNKLGQMKPCSDYKCIDQITVEQVMKKIVSVLK